MPAMTSSQHPTPHELVASFYECQHCSPWPEWRPRTVAGCDAIRKRQIPSDLVVKSQVADIIDLILQLIGYPNGVHRPCRNRKSRGAVLSTSEGQWATTKFDGVWK